MIGRAQKKDKEMNVEKAKEETYIRRGKDA